MIFVINCFFRRALCKKKLMINDNKHLIDERFQIQLVKIYKIEVALSFVELSLILW